jgi:hypothetical protein
MTIFLSAQADKSICGTDKSLSRRQTLGTLPIRIRYTHRLYVRQIVAKKCAWNLDDIMVWYSPCLHLASSLLPSPPPPPQRLPLLHFAIMPLPPHLEDQLSLFDFYLGFKRLQNLSPTLTF